MTSNSKPTHSTEKSEANSGATLRRISSYTDPQGNTYCRREYVYLDMGKRCHPYTVAQIVQFKDHPTGLYAYIVWNLRKRDVTVSSLKEVEHERASQTTELPHLVTKLNSPIIKCRELFKCDKRDTVPVKMIVGKCLVMNYQNISEVVSFVPEPDHFWVVHTYDANGRKLLSFNNKVKVGSEFQADIPEKCDPEAYNEECGDEELIFDGPDCNLDEDQLDSYIGMARLAISSTDKSTNSTQKSRVMNGDESMNLALATLTKCNNDPETALEQLMDPEAPLPESLGSSFTLTANFFDESEIDKFQKGYKFTLNNPGVVPFFQVIKRDYLPHRSLGELIEFYYYWKKTPDGEAFRYGCKQANAERGFIKSRSSVRRATERNRMALASSFKVDDPPRVCGVCQYAENDKSAEFVTESAVGTALTTYLKAQGQPISNDNKKNYKKPPTVICSRCYISFRKYDDFKCHDEPPRPGEVQAPTPTPPVVGCISNAEHGIGKQDALNQPLVVNLDIDRVKRVKKVRKEIYDGRLIQILDGETAAIPFCTRTDAIYNPDFYRRRILQNQTSPNGDVCEPPNKRNRRDSDRRSRTSDTIAVGTITPIPQQSGQPIQVMPQNQSFSFPSSNNNLDYNKCAAIADLLMYRAVTGGGISGPQMGSQPSHLGFGTGQPPPPPPLTPQQAASAMYYLKMAQSHANNQPNHPPGLFVMGPNQQGSMIDTPALRHLSEIAAASRFAMIGQQQRPSFVPFLTHPPQQHDLSRLPGPTPHYNMFPPPPPPPPPSAPPQPYDPMSMLAAAAAGGRVPTPMVRPSSTHNHAHVHAHSHTHLHLNDNPSAAPPPPGAFDAAALMRERDALMRLAMMAPPHSLNTADQTTAMALAAQAASAFRTPNQVEDGSSIHSSTTTATNQILSNMFPHNTAFPGNLRNGSGLALPAPPPQSQNRPSSNETARR